MSNSRSLVGSIQGESSPRVMGGTWHGGGQDEQSGKRGQALLQSFASFLLCSQELEESSIKKRA